MERKAWVNQYLFIRAVEGESKAAFFGVVSECQLGVLLLNLCV